MPDNKPKPTFAKSPVELVERFHDVLSARPRATIRKMFGYPAAFVNGNLATGLYEESWFVRLSEPDTAELMAAGGGPFAPMPGRQMRAYAVLPATAAAELDTAGAWVDKAIDHVATLPPKK